MRGRPRLGTEPQPPPPRTHGVLAGLRGAQSLIQARLNAEPTFTALAQRCPESGAVFHAGCVGGRSRLEPRRVLTPGLYLSLSLYHRRQTRPLRPEASSPPPPTSVSPAPFDPRWPARKSLPAIKRIIMPRGRIVRALDINFLCWSKPLRILSRVHARDDRGVGGGSRGGGVCTASPRTAKSLHHKISGLPGTAKSDSSF